MRLGGGVFFLNIFFIPNYILIPTRTISSGRGCKAELSIIIILIFIRHASLGKAVGFFLFDFFFFPSSIAGASCNM
jgi:hypothetical protein